METVTVNVNRASRRPAEEPANWAAAGPADLEADLRRARAFANWMDARFEVLGIKFGGDAIIGAVFPVIGDTLTSLASFYLVYVARRHDLGTVVQTRMAMNIGIDWLSGLVPAVGDAIDVAYKANLKNLKLLEAAVEKKRQRERRAGR